MKKIILTFILVFVILLVTLISCSEKDNVDDNNTNDATTTTTPDDPIDDTSGTDDAGGFVDRKNVNDDIGEYDFDGADFYVVLSTDQMNEPYFAEEQIGSLINDAVYDRTLKIEERFNVNLVLSDTGGVWNEVAEAVKRSAMSGSGDYDLALAHTFIGLTGLISGGYLYDWNDVPVVDMSKPWWNDSIKDTLTINNKLYTAASDYIYQRPIVIYFNKNMITDYSLDNPYTLVKSGAWTWDTLATMASTVSVDLNGDGAYDESDQYGYAHCVGWQTISVIHAQGMYLTENDSDGYPRYTPFESNKMKDIADKYYKLIYEGNQTYKVIYEASHGAMNGYTPLFGNGQILFLHSNTELLQGFTDVEIDFGMIPLPKYDENQSGYYSMADTQMMVIPVDANDIQMTGVISEALSAESYKTVVPAVYDVMYANRYLRDEESYEMFNLIMDGLVYEFSWTFGEGNNMAYGLPNLMEQKSADIASYYAKNGPSAESAIIKFIDEVLSQ